MARKLDPTFKGVSRQDAQRLADRAKAQGDAPRAAAFQAAANRIKSREQSKGGKSK